MDFLTTVNTVLWVAGNLIGLSIFLSALIFALAYPILFNPALTTAGKRIWRAIFSVGGFGLLAVIGTFIDGRVPWTEMPADVDAWRPIVRIVIYGFIGYSYASLVGLLVLRRFFPNRIKITPETAHLLEDDLDSLGVPDGARVAEVLVGRGWVNVHIPGESVNVAPRDFTTK